MANFVTKRDGSKVAFDQEKIKASVVAAAVDAELSNDQAASIAEEVSNLVSASFEGQEEVSSIEIAEKIVAELEISAPAAAEAWKKYEESKG